jgi:hypothetical protein
MEVEDMADLPGFADVQAAADRGARSLISAEVLGGRLTLSERIEVEDSDGRPVLTLPSFRCGQPGVPTRFANRVSVAS